MITAMRLLGVWLFSLGAFVVWMGAKGTDFSGWFLILALFWGLPLTLGLLIARVLEETPVGAASGLFVAAVACCAMAALRFDGEPLYLFAAATGTLWSLTYCISPLKSYWKSV